MQAASRHQWVIYEGSPARYLYSIAALILGKLKTNNRRLYLNSPVMVAGMRSCLAAQGLDVAQEVGTGALVLSSDQSHLVDGRFQVDNMLAIHNGKPAKETVFHFRLP